METVIGLIFQRGGGRLKPSKPTGKLLGGPNP